MVSNCFRKLDIIWEETSVTETVDDVLEKRTGSYITLYAALLRYFLYVRAPDERVRVLCKYLKLLKNGLEYTMKWSKSLWMCCDYNTILWYHVDMTESMSGVSPLPTQTDSIVTSQLTYLAVMSYIHTPFPCSADSSRSRFENIMMESGWTQTWEGENMTKLLNEDEICIYDMRQGRRGDGDGDDAFIMEYICIWIYIRHGVTWRDVDRCWQTKARKQHAGD